PHKQAAAGAVDRLTATAARLGVVNTVVATPDGLLGDSTDGAGFVDALRAEGADPAGRRAVVLGAGGAAAAVALALADAGAAQVGVAARRPDRAAAVAALAGAAGAVVDPAAVDGADLVVDATSVGMQAGAGLPLALDPARFGAGQVVVDLVYAPPVTPLLRAAAAAGAATANGLGMLVHQAARQVRLFTGADPPLDAMLAAVADRR
ncbi:MAG TPA: NAD(P)-binding domain-containing protein, partial [Acidimicrobiales bacterium]|nr:NAD(P)-binding domain-containing protein [Acidimicrobiales bacterium]